MQQLIIQNYQTKKGIHLILFIFMEPQAIANQSKTNCHAKPAYAAAGNQTASLGVSEVPRVSPRAECRGVQCLPCVCVVLVTRTGSMGVHPYSKETRVPRQPRGFPGVRVDCCWMIFLPFSGMFLSVLVASWGSMNPPATLVLSLLAQCAFR